MIILFLVLLLAAFVVTVVTISIMVFFFGNSTKEATIKFRNFFVEIFKTLFSREKPQDTETRYPTAVGFDGVRFVPQFIDNAFAKVSSNFAVFYYSKCEISKNRNALRYHFAMKQRPDFLPEWELLELLQKQCEKVLTHHLQAMECYLPAEPLTAVRLTDQELLVYFALTPDGIKRLDSIKRKNIRQRALDQAPPTPDTMEESWENEDGKP